MVRPDIIIPAKKEIQIPLSLGSARKCIEHRAGKGPDDKILDAMATAADGISNAAANIKTATERILANQMKPRLQNLANAKRRAKEIYEGRARKLTSARDGIGRAIDQLEAVMAPTPPKDMLGAVTEMKALEVRQVLRAKKPNERLRSVRAAIERGDGAYVAAVINEEPEKSGLEPAEHAVAKDMWQRQWHNDTLTRVARLRNAQAELDRLNTLFGKWSNDILADHNAAIAAAEKSAELAATAMGEGTKPSNAPAWPDVA